MIWFAATYTSLNLRIRSLERLTLGWPNQISVQMAQKKAFNHTHLAGFRAGFHHSRAPTRKRSFANAASSSVRCHGAGDDTNGWRWMPPDNVIMSFITCGREEVCEIYHQRHRL